MRLWQYPGKPNTVIDPVPPVLRAIEGSEMSTTTHVDTVDCQSPASQYEHSKLEALEQESSNQKPVYLEQLYVLCQQIEPGLMVFEKSLTWGSRPE